MKSDIFLAGSVRQEMFSDAIFKMVFGRQPNVRHDKEFLIRYLTSIEKTREELIQSYLDGGLSATQIAAIYETGATPTKEDYFRYSAKILKIWTAIADDPSSAKKIDEHLSSQVDVGGGTESITDLYLEVSHSVIRLCHLLETGARRAHKSVNGSYFLYLLARSVQLLRSAWALFKSEEVSSVLVLIRGVYECFGRMLLVNRRPDMAIGLSLVGMVDGTRFEFCKNRIGKIERRKVREIKTGNEYRCDYSLPEIFRACEADRDLEVYSILYMTLSAEVHPTAELIAEYVTQKGFLLHRDENMPYVLYVAGYVLFLMWREISVFSPLSKRDRRDAAYAVSVIRTSMLEFIGKIMPVIGSRDSGEFEKLFHLIHDSVGEPYQDKYWQSRKEDNG